MDHDHKSLVLTPSTTIHNLQFDQYNFLNYLKLFAQLRIVLWKRTQAGPWLIQCDGSFTTQILTGCSNGIYTCQYHPMDSLVSKQTLNQLSYILIPCFTWIYSWTGSQITNYLFSEVKTFFSFPCQINTSNAGLLCLVTLLLCQLVVSDSVLSPLAQSVTV